MNCEAVREMLWAYLEKETTAEEAVKIEEHLKNCAVCREELKLQQELMETLSGLPDEELPEGYHAELMKKLQAEAAPNVVPFPVRKKNQPVWKQWGMVAAAVLVVVGVGGMNGMLEMREGQNAAVQEMKAEDMVRTAEAPGNEAAVYDEFTDVTENYLGDLDASQITYFSSKAKNTLAAGVKTADVTTGETMAVYDADDAAVAEAAPEESVEKQFSVARSAEVIVTDAAVLTVADVISAKTELQALILAAGGHEEVAATENTVIAVVPVEEFEAFAAKLAEFGELEWTLKGKPEPGAAYKTVEIQLN